MKYLLVGILTLSFFCTSEAQVILSQESSSASLELRNLVKMYSYDEKNYFLNLILVQENIIDVDRSGKNLETSYAEYKLYIVVGEYDEYPVVSIFSLNPLYGKVEIEEFINNQLIIKYLDLAISKEVRISVNISHSGREKFDLSIMKLN